MSLNVNLDLGQERSLQLLSGFEKQSRVLRLLAVQAWWIDSTGAISVSQVQCSRIRVNHLPWTSAL